MQQRKVSRYFAVAICNLRVEIDGNSSPDATNGLYAAAKTCGPVGVLKAGMTLFPMRKKYADRLATLLPDGRIEVDTSPFAGPTEAATYIAGKRVKGGWWFFLADQSSKRSLRDVRREYVEAMAVEAEDDEPDEDGDDDEA